MGELNGLSGSELYDRLHPKTRTEEDRAALPSADTASGRGDLLFLSLHHGDRAARQALAEWDRDQGPDTDTDNTEETP
ncbi:hypothetical protein [Nocardioides sp.]|uniref:hypothetical protein n=1 Tax=Nocardioides sp. TaxID=35761 RepID=UPI0026054F55|nr:hypothetical protein [Nocardioides sp.]MCW2738864.1 hypothetical protein [Nocardioides sp.]